MFAITEPKTRKNINRGLLLLIEGLIEDTELRVEEKNLRENDCVFLDSRLKHIFDYSGLVQSVFGKELGLLMDRYVKLVNQRKILYGETQ